MTIGNFCLVALTFLLSGCAGLQFKGAPADDALTYYEAEPYLLMQKDETCVLTTRVVSLPATKRSVKFNSGLGSAALNITLNENGTISTVGQTTDTKIPETIQAVTGLAQVAGAQVKAAAGKAPLKCKVSAAMFRIVNGRVDLSDRVSLSF